MWPRLLSAALGLQALLAQAPPELAIPAATPVLDGDLAEWRDGPRLRLDQASQVTENKDLWAGAADLSAELMVACDTNHLYLAGLVHDDQIAVGPALSAIDRSDRVEVFLGFPGEGEAIRPAEFQFQLMPLSAERPWSWSDKGPARQSAPLTGVRVVAHRLDDVTYQFEAAIPFHHFPTLRPGADRLGFNVVLHDCEHGDRQVSLAWSSSDPDAGKALGVLRLPRPGPLVSSPGGARLLSEELIEDLPYLLVPLATVVGLVFLLRGWARIRSRALWLRPTLLTGGVVLFLVGLWVPRLLDAQRDAEQRSRLERSLLTLQGTLGMLEQGTLKSYRGASRDRALIEALAGKPIQRQRYTSYRSLATLAPEHFGPRLCSFDDLPVRPYWLPLAAERPQTFQFDPPLHGNKVYLVVGRPYVPSFAVPERTQAAPRLRLELDLGGGEKRVREIDLDRSFLDAASLGREFWEVCVVPVALERDLRALTIAAERGTELTVVGLSLEGDRPDRIEPLLLGAPSLGGVLTDLRGPYPQDAGVELAPGATAKVEVPRIDEPLNKLWLFYRAVYPGVPTANPGARVAEVVLHFADGVEKRTIVLEHQVSMFYELAVHNTRDEPPEGSPAAIALSWIDDNQEKRVNLVYPVLDLPAGAVLEAIEFRNLAEYRMRFRSVVLGSDRAAAPQDPLDAPVIRKGNEIRLDKAVLDRLEGTSVTIYRGGRLSETTLATALRQDVALLPRAVTGVEPAVTDVVLRDGGRRVMLIVPLSGDGWDGAVLGVGTSDNEWASARESHNRLGFVLCLVATPFLLVLLSELLAIATNLRLRLMAVMSVAALVPLGLLSFVLVQVLESGHTSDVQSAMLETVRSAKGQLDDQMERLKSSTRQWLSDLRALATGRLERVKEDQFAKTVPSVTAELKKLLAGQLPPEWHDGFLRLEWRPTLGATLVEPAVLVAGDARLANLEAPARLEPGVFVQWGVLMIGVRAEETVRGGTLSLTAGRPLDGDLLGALAPGQTVLLTDARGYPLAASSGRPDAAKLLEQALDPATMGQRERALVEGLEQGKPLVEHVATTAGNFVCGSEVLRDLQNTPRGLLVVAQPDQRATMDLAIGRIPVRAFFLLVAGSLVVLAAFLSYVVSGRISRPIERLEHGAQALSRGALDTRVVVDEGGQIGRLTRTFNQMAADLQARLQDLQALNRAMRELAAESDEATTLDVLQRFCASHTAADSVLTVLADADDGERLVAHSGSGGPPTVLADGGARLVRLVGAFSQRGRDGAALAAPWASLLPHARSLIGLPIVFAGRARGAVLLGFERPEPLAVDLELLSTVVAQAAIAFERSQLHRLAVQDPVTGVFTPEYFRRRAIDEVSLAQQRGQPLVMLAVALGDGDRRPRGLRRFTAVLRDRLPSRAVLCHAGLGRFQIVLPGAERADAERLLQDAFVAWRELVVRSAANEVDDRPPLGVIVQFPEEAPSAEFLFDTLRSRLDAAQHADGGGESDESLLRSGVTALSPAMRAVYGTLRRVAPTDLPILLEGETGVGKEVLTNLVHQWSHRAQGPLVKVHCAALSETLLASELFGHEKGSFTGADRRKIGRFEQASGGTLFLDEVGDIPLDVQVKLLRVLQEGEVDRVGGNEPVTVDVRVIAATNRDIARMVAAGTFREDLYYRLQGMVVTVPPLRERRAELAGLVEHFRREVIAAGQSPRRTFSTDAMDELYRRDWPGNIRELRNTVFRAMVLARGEVVQLRDVLAALAGSSAGAANEPSPAVASSAVASSAVASGAAADAGEVRVAPGGGEVGAGDAPAPASVLGEGAPATVAGAGRAAIGSDPGASAPHADPAELASERTPSAGTSAEPTFVLPRAPAPEVAEATWTEGPLPARLRVLLQLAVARGAITTQDHMAAAGVSHRTGLRDLQSLVQAGLLERVGSRRGAHYRPTAAGGRFLPD